MLTPKFYHMSVTSLRFVRDYYRRQIWANISFLLMAQQSSSFFKLVEVSLNGLCSIFHRTAFVSCENVLSATHKNSLQNFVDQSEALITPLDEFICVSIL